ncbi:hypothetical protein FKP32DRAFT_141285 [Trametes sanguinea]|nr:hypothetical protein FKP32DRAFT_141285 [Trametes sanguinea]
MIAIFNCRRRNDNVAQRRAFRDRLNPTPSFSAKSPSRGSSRSGSAGINGLLCSAFIRCSDSSQCAIIWQHQCATRLPTSWYCPPDLDQLDKPGKDSRRTPSCAPIIVAGLLRRHCTAAVGDGAPSGDCARVPHTDRTVLYADMSQTRRPRLPAYKGRIYRSATCRISSSSLLPSGHKDPAAGHPLCHPLTLTI